MPRNRRASPAADRVRRSRRGRRGGDRHRRRRVPWQVVQRIYERARRGSPTPTPAPSTGVDVDGGGGTAGARRGRRPGAAAQRPARLLLPRRRAPRQARLDVATAIARIETSNVDRPAARHRRHRREPALLAHWDHLGLCARGEETASATARSTMRAASPPARDRRPPRPRAAPEARHPVPRHHRRGAGPARRRIFRRAPVVPLASIVAAINMDTVAIPRGREGRGDGPRHAGARRADRSTPSPMPAAGSTPTTRPPPSSSARTAGRWPGAASRRSWSAAPSPT